MKDGRGGRGTEKAKQSEPFFIIFLLYSRLHRFARCSGGRQSGSPLLQILDAILPTWESDTLPSFAALDTLPLQTVRVLRSDEELCTQSLRLRHASSEIIHSHDAGQHHHLQEQDWSLTMPVNNTSSSRGNGEKRAEDNNKEYGVELLIETSKLLQPYMSDILQRYLRQCFFEEI